MLGNVEAGNLTNIPGVDLNLLMNFFLDFFLVSLRLGALLISSPIFGARSVPVRVRVVLTFVISAAYYDSVSVPNFDSKEEVASVSLRSRSRVSQMVDLVSAWKDVPKSVNSSRIHTTFKAISHKSFVFLETTWWN